MKQHTLKYTLSELRDSTAWGKEIDYKIVNLKYESGWHFSWMGDVERIKTKMKSYVHYKEKPQKGYVFQNAVAAFDSLEMQHHLEQYDPKSGNTDVYGRTNTTLIEYPIDRLPQKIFELEKVKDFLFRVF
jgi:hypothetical protein